MWKSVAPHGFKGDLQRMRWTILNFQAFQRRSILDVGGKQATTKEKQLLFGPDAGRGNPALMESDQEILVRLLKQTGTLRSRNCSPVMRITHLFSLVSPMSTLHSLKMASSS